MASQDDVATAFIKDRLDPSYIEKHWIAEGIGMESTILTKTVVMLKQFTSTLNT